MSFALGSWWSHDFYEQGLTIMSIVVVLFAGWLAGMMLFRMVADRYVSGHDLAALTYVLSTMAVFFVIAGRLIWSWPEWFTFIIIMVKTISVVMVTAWAWISKQRGPT